MAVPLKVAIASPLFNVKVVATPLASTLPDRTNHISVVRDSIYAVSPAGNTTLLN
jgi:hypothetical protein